MKADTITSVSHLLKHILPVLADHALHDGEHEVLHLQETPRTPVIPSGQLSKPLQSAQRQHGEGVKACARGGFAAMACWGPAIDWLQCFKELKSSISDEYMDKDVLRLVAPEGTARAGWTRSPGRWTACAAC